MDQERWSELEALIQTAARSLLHGRGIAGDPHLDLLGPQDLKATCFLNQELQSTGDLCHLQGLWALYLLVLSLQGLSLLGVYPQDPSTLQTWRMAHSERTALGLVSRTTGSLVLLIEGLHLMLIQGLGAHPLLDLQWAQWMVPFHAELPLDHHLQISTLPGVLGAFQLDRCGLLLLQG